MSASYDLLELSRHLKQERLFINSEREHLNSLNEELSKTAETVYHLSWVVRKQKKTLNQLIRAEAGATPEVCCQRCNNLEKANFVDGYKGLSYHEAKIGELLKALRDNPKLVGNCLMHSEIHSHESMQSFAQVVYSSIYGDGVMPEDEGFLLQVLRSLIHQQVAINDNPRRMLRKGSCAFSMLFKLLHENMFSAKLFLTAALHKPIMQLLMEDEWFYDIDPERALYRFPPAERIKRFGTPDTPEYEKRTAEYRVVTAAKLVMLAERFIASLRSSLYCFPQSLAWLMRQLYTGISKADKVDASEARNLCADLVFAMFICPAVCDPEPYGITSDAPISYIARHNLMQVAQILQVLALSSPDEIDPKTRGLYEKFEKGCMSSLLDSLLEGPTGDQLPPSMALTLQGCARSAVLMTLSELVELIRLLRVLVDNMEDSSPERKMLESLLEGVPPVTTILGLQNTPTSTPQATPPGTPPILKRNPRGRDPKKVLLSPENNVDSEEKDKAAIPEDVLVISLGILNECPGMLSENKVLDMDKKKNKPKVNQYIAGEDDPVPPSGEVPLQEKRTRFSLSHDQESIATSDNLEAISEAASSHSVESDDIDGDENDNLSDMVSANVSGRDTPNISGRDTPLSQAGSQAESVEEPRRAPDLPVIVQKTNREDVTDRFGKFELEREEIKSTVSDTWSTDVLASDSEPPETNHLERLEEVAEEMMRHNLLGVQEVLEVSETASDAWSTDVLASDTSERQAERLMELDQDEMGSISSRSQGLDDSEAGDVQENEETPQGPGCQSPMRGGHGHSRDTDHQEVGAVGGHAAQPLVPSAVYTSIYRSMRGPYTERFSEPSAFSGAAAGGGAVEGRRAVSDFGTFSHIEGNRQPFQQSNPRVATSIRYADGRVGSVLQAFDPLASPKGGSQADGAAGEPDEILSQGIGLMEGSTSTLDTDDGSTAFMGPGNMLNGLISPESSSSAKSSGQNSNDVSHESVIDLLSSSLTGGLKLTDQQNFNIDTNRLSATISLFDPLMSGESSTDPEPTRPTRPVTAPAGNGHLNHSKSSAFAPQPFGLSSRPKTIPGAMAPIMANTPRIAVQVSGYQMNDSLDIFDNTPKQADTASADSLFDNDSLDLGDSRLGAENAGLGQSSDSLNKSRSSTDSSLSSLVDPSMINTRSISFQPVQPRYDKDEDDRDKKKPSFFKSFKDKLSKGSKRKFPKPFERDSPKDELERGGGDPFRYSVSLGEDAKNRGAEETSDDILNKYRKAPNVAGSDTSSTHGGKEKSEARVSILDDVDSMIFYDPNNLENCKAFLDAKRKLRLVLSTADIQVLPTTMPGMVAVDYAGTVKQHELLGLLKMQLAEAINLQDKDLVAQLHETIRCLQQFNVEGTKKLLKAIREEYKSRAPYIAYLVRCRQGLLSTQAYLDRLLTRVKRDKTVCNKYLLSVLVRLFLEKKERNLMKFISEFQKLTMPDEKTDLVERFMEYLAKSMMHDQIWKEATNDQLEEARLFIERNVMSHIYTHAIFPNGDGDIARDRILHEHMVALSAIITPTHKDLRISKMYHYECPWPAAQAEIFMINAYKTPKDKLACVLRCSSTIMNLLSLANEKSVPAADDFMPVLIFVLIKANPPNLMSTVQYVNSFYENRLQGEEQYWWMQFSSAIEFIKTMDYLA